LVIWLSFPHYEIKIRLYQLLKEQIMALFKLGQTVATPGALTFCKENEINPALLLARHQGGDWGDLSESDTHANVRAIQCDERILSSYKLNGEKLYVITEWDRSSTCILLASEY
jgi:hypothetical protein